MKEFNPEEIRHVVGYPLEEFKDHLRESIGNDHLLLGTFYNLIELEGLR